MGKYCIPNFSVCLYPTYPPQLTTPNPAYQLYRDKDIQEPCLFLACSLELSTTWLVYCIPKMQNHLVPPNLTAFFHYSQSVCLLISQTCCCRIACLLHHSSEPQIPCPNCWQTLYCEQITMQLYSLLLLSASVSLSHCLNVNAILCIIQSQSIFKLERERRSR